MSLDTDSIVRVVGMIVFGIGATGLTISGGTWAWPRLRNMARRGVVRPATAALTEDQLSAKCNEIEDTYNALREENADLKAEVARLKKSMTSLAESITEASS